MKVAHEKPLHNLLIGLGNAARMILLPMVFEDHFFIVAANVDTAIVTYYNSLGSGNRKWKKFAEVVVSPFPLLAIVFVTNVNYMYYIASVSLLHCSGRRWRGSS